MPPHRPISKRSTTYYSKQTYASTTDNSGEGSESSMDVCYVVNAVDVTSIPSEIAVGLNSRPDVNVDLVSWFSADSFPGPDQIKVYSLDGSSSMLTSVRRFRKIISEYDIVHTHHTHSGSIAKFVGKTAGAQLVATENSAHGRLTGPGYYANGITNAFADAVVCVSDAVRESFECWELSIAPKIETIYNGVNLDRIREVESADWQLQDVANVDEDSFVISHAGSMKPAKSQSTLIEGVGSLVNSGYDVELVIAGDGRLRSDLESLVKKHGLGDVVHFLGQLPREEAYMLMDASDAFAMPSRSEGYCVAVAEAMAIETPCVISDIDVFREIYGDAALYHSVSNGGELANQIEYLFERPEERAAIAKQGRELVEASYSLESTIDNYYELYKSLGRGN